MDSSAARLLRGFLEPCLLSLLAEHADYGLSLAQRLASAGLDEVPGGTLYPALMRLEKRGLVAVSWRPSTSGPARKYYELTDADTPNSPHDGPSGEPSRQRSVLSSRAAGYPRSPLMSGPRRPGTRHRTQRPSGTETSR